MSDTELVLYDLQDNVAVVTLNQPESLNSMTPDISSALGKAIDRAAAEARAIVLTGNGRAFCAGANLKARKVERDDTERDMGEQLEAAYNPFLTRLMNLDIPLITAVNGAAAGIGCSIALMGDIIVAGRSAYFLQAFCKVGLVPDGGSAYLLSKAIGRVRAMELMLLGERYPAERAEQDGLITRVVDDAEVVDTAREYAGKIASGPALTLGMIRKSAWAALDSSFEDQLARERHYQKQAGQTEDFFEGVTAFREKRKANFQGK